MHVCEFVTNPLKMGQHICSRLVRKPVKLKTSTVTTPALYRAPGVLFLGDERGQLEISTLKRLIMLIVLGRRHVPINNLIFSLHAYWDKKRSLVRQEKLILSIARLSPACKRSQWEITGGIQVRVEIDNS